ncbi:shikimate dehydrogenase [Schnuerera sp. xch1]|uniref:shikimate dehydrogenase n=1 Tax=Schnuerera sp. xch1 TaxID=2874283 RepID=UPI001CC1C1BA|nr:shikimate dehydrogenase [Schnuerera sp. xch1]MBZ2175533.1 shikimate dehydrogenase [Schnuerera sp. xch1]
MSNRIQGTTTLMGLIGYPLKHSKSPHMHNTAFEALGLDHVYMAFEIQDGFIKEALDAMRILNVGGFNITMPHKKEVVEYLDDISPDAKIIGSVNTVKNDNGKLIGYNTDGRGFVKALQENGIDFKGKKVVLAGAGGAARAVATQLAFDGAGELILFNRTLSSAEEIVNNINKNIPTCKSKALALNEAVLVEEIKDALVLVNCTSLGMKVTIDQAIISSPEKLPKDLFVADIVYDPNQTKLLKIAEKAGCRYMNGLMMMIWQGAIAFKIWTDKDMPIDLIKREIFGK